MYLFSVADCSSKTEEQMHHWKQFPCEMLPLCKLMCFTLTTLFNQLSSSVPTGMMAAVVLHLGKN
jgi:hypothetical protein